MAEEHIMTLKNETIPEDYYSDMMDKDHTSDHWLLINTAIPVLAILLLYLLVILKIGPSYMEDRRPYELKIVMRIYNIIQVITNISLLYPLITYFGQLNYVAKLSCKLPSDSDEMVEELKYMYLIEIWCYLVLKIFDLLDTVFMVLRKKDSHITFLHVYHHVAMVFFTWVTAKYIKAHQAVIPGVINIVVHIIMYSYYFLATFGPAVEQYLWWKQHLTKLQLGQFAFVFMYLFLLYYNDCPISKVFTYIWLFNVFVFLCLFVDFYVKAYIVNRDKKDKKAKVS